MVSESVFFLDAVASLFFLAHQNSHWLLHGCFIHIDWYNPYCRRSFWKILNERVTGAILPRLIGIWPLATLTHMWSIIIKIKGTANLVKSPFIWWLFVIATIHCSPLMSDLQESEKNGIPDCSFHFFLFVKQWEQNLRNKRNILKWPNENLLRDSLSSISIFWFNSKCLHLYLVLNLD